VPIPKTDRPYFEAWLRRTGRQFAISGRLTQIAGALAAEEGGTVEEWRMRLRILLDGGEIPSLELLTRIDALLAGASKTKPGDGQQGLLF
jgi:hypothetical protein